MNGFMLSKVGALTTIQDAGRLGHHRIGLTTGGPLDAPSWHWANRLVGNAGADHDVSQSDAVLECVMGGVVFETMVSTRIAVTGAPSTLEINGRPQPLNQTHCLEAGDRVSLGVPDIGLCNYIGFAGGIRSPLVLGSRATVVRESIGGLRDDMCGGPLKRGDFVPIEPAVSTARFRLVPSAPEGRAATSDDGAIRVILGDQNRLFDRSEKRRFFDSVFSVDRRSDRMGYRMNGPAIQPPDVAMQSEGLCAGSIQITPDGTPIVMLADRQTMGGYPKIGAVIAADLHHFGQKRPGDAVRFAAVTPATARLALEQYWLEIRRKRLVLI